MKPGRFCGRQLGTLTYRQRRLLGLGRGNRRARDEHRPSQLRSRIYRPRLTAEKPGANAALF